MRDYVLVTDSDTEIPHEFAKQNDIPVFLMPYTLNGVEELYDLGEKCDENAFFEALRNGASASTSTRTPADIEVFFESQVSLGYDVLYLCFSSMLSGHHDLCVLAKEEVLKKYPDARIEIVDTKKVSMGAGILVINAVALKGAGKSLDEVKDWVESNKTKANAWFMVDDLGFLKRGGRLTGAQAMVGSLLDVKPILVVNKEGKVINVDKVKGKKKAMSYLTNVMKENIENPQDQDVFVLHGGVYEDALLLKKAVEAEVNPKSVSIKMVGPVIGAHAGPNVLAVIFMGKETA